MSRVIDLYQWRDASRSLSHPAGVVLPLEDRAHADLLIPQVRGAIASGRHCADVIRGLGAAVRQGDRVLVVGSALGILSTLAARMAGAAKIIAIEPNVAVAPYVEAVHRANGVPWVETLNAVPHEKGQGRVPLFVRHDVRASSLSPDDGPWRQVMLVPAVDLGLILREERVGLVVAESLSLFPGLVECAADAGVERMVVGCERGEPAAPLAANGLRVGRSGAALVVERQGSGETPAGGDTGMVAAAGTCVSGRLA